MAQTELKKRRRSDYGFSLDYRTRWSDNDMYSHVNNSVYLFLFDSIVNTYLITHCGLVPATSAYVGLVVHSHADYFAPVAFPAVLDLCLRVRKLGKASVTYEVAVFERGTEAVACVGEFVHVFVEAKERRPTAEGMPKGIREGLAKLLVKEGSKL